MQTLFRNHARGIAVALTRRGAPRELAEDVTQDVFVRLLVQWQRLRQLDDGRDPAPFLLRIARNLMIDQWRREQALERVHLAPGLLEELADPAPGPEQVLAGRQRLDRMVLALAEMPERTRRAFELHRIDGRTIAEVAAELGISSTRAWTLIHDAYRLIRQRLNED